MKRRFRIAALLLMAIILPGGFVLLPLALAAQSLVPAGSPEVSPK